MTVPLNSVRNHDVLIVFDSCRYHSSMRARPRIGEDGYFGYGPIYHEKVWQVPFLEGKLR